MSACPDPATLCRLLDSQLPKAERLAVEAHVESCPDCEQKLAAMTGAMPLLFLPISTTVHGDTVPPTPAAAPRVPGYELYEELGRGGMGVVYRALQLKLNRIVALKVIRPEVLGNPTANTDDLKARFRTEALAAARIGHAHIIPVHEVGETPECLYYAMHYVDGPSLATVRQAGPLPAATVVNYLKPIALALHHAHQHGILHRDVKPSNILLDRQGHPYLADFGLAQWREVVHQQTHSGVLLGTPEFMSPEQARDSHRVGPVGEVYSLGATLYDLLTGRPPFQAATKIETLRQVLHEDPVPPRRLNPAIDRDLETIVLKCLDKEPSRRYETAQALADDLQRYRDGQPIHARPLGRLARLARWARRHPGTAWAGSLFLITLLTLLAVAVVAGVQQRALRQEAEQAYRRERLQGAQTSLLYAISRCEAGEVGEGLLLFASTLRMLPEDEPALEREIRLQLAAWTVGLRPVIPLAREGRVVRSAFSPDGRLLATGDANGHAVVWNADTGARVLGPLSHPDKVNAVAFNAAGTLLATACENGHAQLWSVATGEKVGPALPHDDAVLAVALSPDGTTLATGSGRTPGQHGEAALWDVAKGERLARLQVTAGKPVRSLAFSPDGRVLAAAGEEPMIRLWDVEGRTVQHELTGADWTHGVIYDPRGRSVAVWYGHLDVHVWDLGEKKPPRRTLRGQHPIGALTYSPDGRSLYSVGEAGSAGELRRWDVASGEPRDGPRHVLFPARALAVTGDVLRLGNVGWNPQLGSVSLRPATLATFPHGDPIRCAAWSPDRDGKYLLIGGDKHVSLWDRQGQLQRRLDSDGPYINAVTWSADGRRVAVGGTNKAVAIRTVPGLELQFGPLVHDAWVYGNLFSPDGRTLYTADEDGVVRTWDLSASPAVSKVHLQLKAPVYGSTLLRDGQTYAAATRDGLVRLWDTTTWKQVGATFEHPGPVFGLARSADDRYLLTGCQDRQARLWDVESGRLAGSPLRNPSAVKPVDILLAEDLAATAYAERGGGAVRLWSLRSGRPIGPPLHHAGVVQVVAFSPDGQSLLSGGGDGVAYLWPLPRPMGGDRAAVEAQLQTLTAMELDEGGMPRPLAAAQWMQRRQDAEPSR